MARERLDPTGNESMARQIAKLNRMLTELYAANAAQAGINADIESRVDVLEAP